MAKLPRKPELFARFEEAVRLSGWDLLYLSEPPAHPAKYRIFRGTTSVVVRVFIWNITHGGKSRADDEYRIQVTGFSDIEPERGARSLILGWWEDEQLFTGWDFRQHIGHVSASPSMQVKEGALVQAARTGFAPYINQNGETAIAFRPDFMGTYIEFLEPLHDSGRIPGEASILERISEGAEDVEDKDIDLEVAEKRRFAIVSTKRALRALDFSRRVLIAYEHKCAMCRLQLRLVEGAHILPVAHEDSTDQTSNGIALCVLHHRAYDNGLVAFDSDFKIDVNQNAIARLEADDRAGGLKRFCDGLRPSLAIPRDRRDRPAKLFVETANALRGWSF
jgi:putative restriction endonuclease